MKASPRFAEYVRKIKCDDWIEVKEKDDMVVLEHVPTGQTVAYCTHDGGNDYNGPRNFALAVQRICGCRLIEPRGRKKSRKSLRTEPSPQIVAQRRKYAEAVERRRRAAQTSIATERQERERQVEARMSAEQYQIRKRELAELLQIREAARMEVVRDPTSLDARRAFLEAHQRFEERRDET